MNKTTLYILLCFSLASLTTCKKYPENSLWFKNPEKVSPFEGHITKYNVNGIDSLELLSVYFGNIIGLKKSIKEATFIRHPEGSGAFENVLSFGSSGLQTGVLVQFTKRKKYMKIGIVVDTTMYKKNLFIDVNIEWKIIRLAKKGPLKIETTLDNGNKYEVQIE